LKLELLSTSARHPASQLGAAPALKGLSLQVASGELVAIIGPSGAGKTTLLQVLACAMQPTEGKLALDGVNPWQLPRRALQHLRGRLFLAPQVPPLPPRQRVVTATLAARLPAMGLMASLRSLIYPTDMAAAHEALARFDLADKLFDRVDRLSGGERQRVGLARALLAPARVWLIDEPLSALDPARAQQAISTLLSCARERGITLVTTLHQVDVALAHFPRIMGLRDGALAFDLPAAQVTPQHLAKLYAQFEHELRGEKPLDPPETPSSALKPVVMHCR
jgi:phosphonate transport system ATP-binding protein